MKRVFAAVTGDAHLRQAQDARLAFTRVFNGRDDVLFVTVPIERCLIENSCRDFNPFHVSPHSAPVSFSNPATDSTCRKLLFSSIARGWLSVQTIVSNRPLCCSRCSASPGKTPCVVSAATERAPAAR